MPEKFNKLVIFSGEMHKRLKRASEFTGSPEMEIVRAGVAARLNEIEEEMRKVKSEKEERANRRILSSAPSTGLGIARKSTPIQPTAPTPTPVPTTPQIILVQPQTQVAAAGGAPVLNNTISNLATWIAGESDYFENIKRKQTAVDIIKTMTTDNTERERLAAALDEEVEICKRKQEPLKSGPLDWIKRVVGV